VKIVEYLKNPKVYIFGILSAIFFGTLPIVGKLSMLEMNSQTMVTLRFLMIIAGALIFLLMSGKLKDLIISNRDVPLMLAGGVLLAFETLFFWWGIANVNIIPLLAIYWSYPIFNLSFDIISKEIKFHWYQVAIILIGIIGVYLGGVY